MVNAESKARRKESLDERRPKISPRAVLAPEFLQRNVPLRAAWVGTLKDKRHISTAIRHLTRVLPGMSHLKRCSGKRLVLAFAAPNSVDNSPPALPTVGNSSNLQLQELEELLGSFGDDFERSNFEGDLVTVRVPAGAPRTKAQACAASKIWPLNFHPDPYVERTLSGSCFTPEDLGSIDRCVGLCVEAARREARGNDDCTGSAIVFDPRRGKIVAIAASRIDLHPMWHAAILAVDLVARLQGGGAYDLVGASVGNRKRKYTGSRPEIRLPVAFPVGLLELAKREGDSTSGCEVEETGSRAGLRLPVLAKREGDSTSGCEVEETGSRAGLRLPVLAKREGDSTSGCEVEETGSRAGLRLPVLAKREGDSTSGCEIEETGSRAEIRLPAGLPELTRREETSTSGCEIEDTGSRSETQLPVAFPVGLPELARREEISTSGFEVEETGSRSETQLPVAFPVGLPELTRREEISTSNCEVEETGSRPETQLPVAFPVGLPELTRREETSTSGCEIEDTGSRSETQLPVAFPVGLPELTRPEETSTSGFEIEETGSRSETQPPLGLPELARREETSTSGCKIDGQERGKNGDSEYLCTNYWAFLLREPCPLCAMALVHSRVSDIFWGAENERRGVLGSKALLHAVPGLNHRYRVWRGVREEECRRVCGEIVIRR